MIVEMHSFQEFLPGHEDFNCLMYDICNNL